MIGGGSILFIIFDKVVPLQNYFQQEQLVLFFFGMSFLINLPHFSSSYQLFYIDHRKKIFTSWLWKVIGIVAPLILFLFMMFSYILTSWRDIAYMITVMFILVGWHYTRQVFGCVVVLAYRSDYHFSSFQRRLLKVNLFGIWLLTVTAAQQNIPILNYNSLDYPFMYIPEKYSFIIYGVIITSLIGYVVSTYGIYKKDKKFPPLMSWIPLIAIHLWFLPHFNSYVVLMALPLFHSLQYLLFVFTYKGNQHKKEQDLFGPKKSLFFISALFIGAIFMEILPRILDITISFQTTSITIFLVMFSVFINIHHYLIDFVMWRRNVAEFEMYILEPRPESQV